MSSDARATVGKHAPDFKCAAVVDGRLKEVTLSAYTVANHWLILVFFPKAWSFICPTEIKAFSEALDEFLYKRTCAVVFASTDSEYCLKAWNATSELEGGLGGVHVPLLSDVSHRLSRAYGVLNEEEGIAQRALFIIDPKGIVRAISVNDTDVGRSVPEALRLLDALIFTDEFGQGCPIDWKKGDLGIEMKTKTTIEGPIEVPGDKRKSWTDWARPKLARAWSGTSTRSAISTANSNIVLNANNGGASSNHASHSLNGSLTVPSDLLFSGQAASGTSSPSPGGFRSDSQGTIGNICEVQRRMEQLHASVNHHTPSVGVSN